MIRKWVLIAAISVGLLGGASYYLHSRTQPQSVSFRTSAVEKGPVCQRSFLYRYGQSGHDREGGC